MDRYLLLQYLHSLHPCRLHRRYDSRDEGGRIASGTAFETNAWNDCRGNLESRPLLSNRISPAGRNDSSLKSLKQPGMTCSKVSPVLLLIAILISKCAIVTSYNSGGFIDRQVIKVSFGNVTFLICFFINGDSSTDI